MTKKNKKLSDGQVYLIRDVIRVKYLRHKDIAAKLGTSDTVVSRYLTENGEIRKTISEDVARNIYGILGDTSLDFLTDYDQIGLPISPQEIESMKASPSQDVGVDFHWSGIVDSYTNRIKALCRSMPIKEKAILLGDLDDLVEKYENPHLGD